MSNSEDSKRLPKSGLPLFRLNLLAFAIIGLCFSLLCFQIGHEVATGLATKLDNQPQTVEIIVTPTDPAPAVAGQDQSSLISPATVSQQPSEPVTYTTAPTATAVPPTNPVPTVPAKTAPPVAPAQGQKPVKAPDKPIPAAPPVNNAPVAPPVPTVPPPVQVAPTAPPPPKPTSAPPPPKAAPTAPPPPKAAPTAPPPPKAAPPPPAPTKAPPPPPQTKPS